MPALLMQYFKNGFEVVAKNLKYVLNRMNVVMFQLITKPPNATPTKKALKKFTSPKYSGERKSELAP